MIGVGASKLDVLDLLWGRRLGQFSMLFNINSIPWIHEPLVRQINTSKVVLHDIIRQGTLLGLELVVENKDTKFGIG